MIRIMSPGIARIPHLDALLGEEVSKESLLGGQETPRAVAGWGRKPTTAKARRYARSHGLPYLCLEDGFLRSVGLGHEDAPLSLVIDDLGIYYDATTHSRLEDLVRRPRSATEVARARMLKQAWRETRVSKYNHLREFEGTLPTPYVLVVDQTFGDASITYGLAEPASFHSMLSTALEENPGLTVLVKVHPDVIAGRKKGHFDPTALAHMQRVALIADEVHPTRLIESARSLYVVTSQLGFEGLLWDKPVRTFGMPFYAGWGLTDDALPPPVRRRPVPLESLVHAALVDYARYLDPETGSPCEAERLLDWMGLQRRMRQRFPRLLHGVGFSPWKRPIVRDFLQGSAVHFVKRPEAVAPNQTLAVWGLKETGSMSAIRLEDGFLRSVGLGTDLIRPLSWVTDRTGIYYDSSRPSDLEQTLETAPFEPALLARARALRERIVSSRLTKYNVGGQAWQRPKGAKRIILVPGQVETDASIASGAPGIRRNMDLLRTVREANPEAYLLYKPHPDVVAGLRARGQGEEGASQCCDEVVDGDLIQILGQVDALHVMTSLAGFEALLRGKAVTCHGQPFYAGWGLTTDLAPVARRTRRLCLDSLVAGTLILYPTYISRVTGRFTTPERALDELLEWRSRRSRTLPLWRYLFRILLRLNKR